MVVNKSNNNWGDEEKDKLANLICKAFNKIAPYHNLGDYLEGVRNMCYKFDSSALEEVRKECNNILKSKNQEFI